MAEVTFRFYGELNDFLPPWQRQTAVACCFERRTSVKDMIEALGVPHPEIALIAVNSVGVGFDHIVHDGERIAVYPSFRTLELEPNGLTPVGRPEPVRFVLDANLGALARRLRLCGFDAHYRNDIDDGEFAEIAGSDGRIALTRDRDALKRRRIGTGYYVRSEAPDAQLAEVFHRYRLHDRTAPFTRCARCNGTLKRVSKDAIIDRLEPLTRQHFETFRQCRECGQVYWRGIHVEGIERLVASLRNGSPSGEPI